MEEVTENVWMFHVCVPFIKWYCNNFVASAVPLILLSEMMQPHSDESQKTTLYHKVNLLSEEIQEELKNISDAPRSQVSNDIEVIREISYQEKAPEAEFVIRLFRRYAIQAQSLKTGKGGKESIFHRSIHMGKTQISSLHAEGATFESKFTHLAA